MFSFFLTLKPQQKKIQKLIADGDCNGHIHLFFLSSEIHNFAPRHALVKNNIMTQENIFEFQFFRQDPPY